MAQNKETDAKANNQDNRQKSHKQKSHTSGRPTTLKTHDKHITYTYDTHGRLLYKTQTPLGKDRQALKQSSSSIIGYRKSLQLEYNANNELSKSLSITQEGLNLTEVMTTYHYDAFGRRIAKHSQTRDKTKRVNKHSAKFAEHHIQQQKTKYKHSHYLWDSDKQLQEQTDTHVYTTIYDDNGFEPVARLVWLKEGLTIAANDEPENDEGWYGNDKPAVKTGIQVYHYHNDQLGTPNELTNEQGEVVWLADYQAWGNTAKVVWREQLIDQMQVSQDELQPIRFQGQYYDEETGLHYNRFRYYDPDVGMFTTRDPIGLMGGDNVFAYAPNPTGWIDPLGLNRKVVNLGQGYEGAIDTFNTGGQASFEIHVYNKSGREVGMYGPNGWFNKHGLTGRPAGLPAEVENQCKGQAIDISRRQGLIPDKGKANIKDSKWMKFLNIIGFGTLIEMTKPSPRRACELNPLNPLCQDGTLY